MDTLAVLIPTYGRYDRMSAIVANIHNFTTVTHKIYFICENEDSESIAEAKRLNEECIVVSKGTYVAAINMGYKATTEPYIFLGSDDIELTKDWDTKMMEMFTEGIGVVGARDEWEISKTDLHGSHLMISRDYIKNHSGVMDEPDTIYSSRYIHTMCDIETEQTAMGRKAFAMSSAFISHKHWFLGTAKMDATYQRATVAQERDNATYQERRKKFELYKFEDLFVGKVTPVYNEGLTVVIPSYNEVYYLRQTVESLKANTLNKYELIIIDDASDAETVAYIKTLDCVKVFNKRQAFVNANWNLGIKLATNKYVCIANNDITFSKHWDKALIKELEKPNVWIASPYQTDNEYKTAYGRHERSGNINLRGSCFMLKKEMISTTGYIPIDMLIWFGDWWLTWVAEQNHKRCVFTDKSVIYHYGSRSSVGMMQDRLDLFQQIIRGDAYAFHIHTGIDVSHWLQIIYNKLRLPSPV